MSRGGFLVFGEIDDPGLAKSGVAFDRAVDAAPDAQRFDDERELARIAPLLAAEAPIAARLFAADMALLAQRHRDPFLRQEEGRRNADDAATDDDDIDARGKFTVGCNGLDTRGHGSTLRDGWTAAAVVAASCHPYS